MRTPGPVDELERRRLLAIQRLLEGYSPTEVAEFLGVTPQSVRRWHQWYREGGLSKVAAQPASGRPPKLTRTQEKIVLRWVNDDPKDFGFATNLWTTRRVAQLILDEFGIEMNHRYLAYWLRQRGLTPQKPVRVPRERDPERITRWLETDWPRIKKSATPERIRRIHRRKRSDDDAACSTELGSAGPAGHSST